MKAELDGPVHVRAVAGKTDLRRFIRLPRSIHRGNGSFVPALLEHERRLFSTSCNKASSYCDFTLAMAWRSGAPVGRIAGIINHRASQALKVHTGRFGFFECIDDAQVSVSLLGFVEEWARSRGQRRIIGPMGFTDQDPEGLLIEGFEFAPTLATNHQPPYYVQLIERAGYVKDVDYLTYRIPVRLPERQVKLADRISAHCRYRLVEFRRRRDLKPYVTPILSLMNETYSGLYGYLPLDEAEMTELAGRYLGLLDPRFIKVITRGEEVVAFFIAMPNLSDGFRKAGGRLFPLGLVHLWRARRASKQLDLLLGGIRSDVRGRGLDSALGVAMVRAAVQAKLEYIDTHNVLETNARMRAECAAWGGWIYKRHRVYQKLL